MNKIAIWRMCELIKYLIFYLVAMNKKYSTILVPHHGSEMSEKAVEESIKFAKVFGSEIMLLYIVDERYAPPSSSISSISDRTSLKEAKNELKRVLETQELKQCWIKQQHLR